MTRTIIRMLGYWLLAAALTLVTGGGATYAGQRGAPGQGRGPGPGAAVAPAEIQRLFDAYALVQAQTQLQLSDEEYPQFLARFKALQDARRRGLQQHTRLVLELRRLLTASRPDEGQLKDRVQALRDADARSAVDIRNAYDAVDQILDVKRQAEFRVFEEMMERRKLELVTRARQAIRQRPQP